MNYREMSRLAADPAAVRARAEEIATVLGDRATPWQARFLSRLAQFEGPELLSMSDREVLYQLAGKASRRSERSGFRAATLVEKLWCLRSDLPEEDEAFLTTLRAEGSTCAPTRNQWNRLFGIARQLGEIDHYVA